ncbi:UNVERIFIED_CONTAM: hypothetical protein Slati_3879900 [Sesamum latifolium]|uniref:Uncharacterized protein n=1 Tax=Sesamum latifolium TaxID=2727402 RepID=A0AAW2TML3_9LAMI
MKIWLTMKGLLIVIQVTRPEPTDTNPKIDEIEQWTRKDQIEQELEKYSVSKFMRYQMVEDRSVAEQTHEIINLEHALADAEMKLPEKFLVMSIVDKFPKS